MWSGNLLVVVLVLAVTVCTHAQSVCLQGTNCHLPDCFCSTNSINMARNETPQIVYFGMDDAVNINMAQYYRQLFPVDRLNPNGCPVSMTLYVQDLYTDYSLVDEFYQKGMEIAVHSVTHTNIDTAEKLLNEADQQRNNLAVNGYVPIEKISGWRSPNLKTVGDEQPDILKDLNYTYDISLTVTRSHLGANKPWPYTLDYGNPHKCMVSPCPSNNVSHPGFWEVPINALVDYKDEYPCVYVDGCYNTAATEEQAYNYLWQNFLDYYEGSRTPLGFNMHAAWFMSAHNLKAMDIFIHNLLTLPDVYIVSVDKMLDWVKHQVPLSQIHQFQPWNCSSPSNATRTNVTIAPNTTPATTTPVMTPSTNPTTSEVCQQGLNCKLPGCLCRSTEPPENITRQQTPQMVTFTFDGPVSAVAYYTNLISLFNTTRKNSNNCSISSTLFVKKSGNNPNYLQHLLNIGMEVALRGYTQSGTTGNISGDIAYLKANSPVQHIKGWRSPSLQPQGDGQFNEIKNNNMSYDSTLKFPASAPRNNLPWPYTMDFKWQEPCPDTGCPVEKHPGLWEIPVTPFLDYKDLYLCTYADGCILNPPTANETFNFLWKNFKTRYDANRTPVSITLRQQWFSHPIYKPNLEGLDRFIKKLVSMSDVYIVSIEKVIAWMRNPTPLQGINVFQPWQCN